MGSIDAFTSRLTKEKLLLPPLADYTDYPYRKILAEFNSPFLCTEMVSPVALIRENPRTMDMVKMVEGEQLNGVQLVGSDPEPMGGAAQVLEEHGFDYIDINMGCTVKAVTRTGAGVALMGTPEKAVELVSSVVDNTALPVTCKLRLGVTESSKNALALSKQFEDIGVSAITVHGRTGEKKFGLAVDYDTIQDVVEAVDVPVIGNGGVFNGGDALSMIEATGVAAVMPGRGLIGNPWIVKDISSALKGSTFDPPSLDERKTVFTRHLRYLCDFFGERSGVLKSRRIIGKYFAGSLHISRLKLKAQRASSVLEMSRLLDGLVLEDGRATYNEASGNGF